MLTVRNTLVALICISPFILVWDGLIAQGIVAGVIAFALAITARTLRPGETEFLVSIIPTLIVAAAVPALWLLFQVLPLGVLVHPIWMSAEKALGHPVHGAVSVDPGAGLIALGQYLSMCAVMVVSAAVAVDRQRAEWILFALTAAAAAIALMVLTDDLAFAGVALPPLSRLSAIDCASLGMIIATAACLRAIERYETHRSAPSTADLVDLCRRLPRSGDLLGCADSWREVLDALRIGMWFCIPRCRMDNSPVGAWTLGYHRDCSAAFRRRLTRDDGLSSA